METPSWRTNEAGDREHYTSEIQGKDLGLDIQILAPNPFPLPRPLRQRAIQHGQKPVPALSTPVHTVPSPLQDERKKKKRVKL